MVGSRLVSAFAIANFVLAAVWFAFIVMLMVLLVSMLGRLVGLFPSPDPVEDLFTLTYGLCGMLALYLPGLVAFSAAGIGLRKRAAWGYHWHLAAAVLAAVSCFGVVYTLIAFWFAARPEFRAELLSRRKTSDLGLHELAT